MSDVMHDAPADHSPDTPAGDYELARQQAVKQIERRRRFWTGTIWSGVGMAILVIIWAATEYHNAGGWPVHGFSQSSGIYQVWNFWIVYPLGAWLLIVAAQHFVLKIPGGPVRIVQNKLYQTPLMGYFPVVW